MKTTTRRRGWFQRALALACLGGLISGCAPLIKVKKFGKDGQIAYWTAEGSVVIASGLNAKDVRMCVAPPGQAAREFDVSNKTAVGGSTIPIRVDQDTGVDHETALLYQQSRSLLLFQFSMYRLCEMYVNGAIDKQEYQAQFNKILALGEKLVEAEIARENAEAQRLQLEQDRLQLLKAP